MAESVSALLEEIQQLQGERKQRLMLALANNPDLLQELLKDLSDNSRENSSQSDSNDFANQLLEDEGFTPEEIEHLKNIL